MKDLPCSQSQDENKTPKFIVTWCSIAKEKKVSDWVILEGGIQLLSGKPQSESL